MPIVNINARVTGNAAVYVQYQEDGKAKDAAFVSWLEFINWMEDKFKQPEATKG
jgi:hypothetical protein